MPDGLRTFRELCTQHGIAVTHQRQVLYETMQSMYGHPSPEEVFAAVKQRIPSISLATVYKNIHLFVESGVFRELSIHHGTLRVEMNKVPHHHMVCSVCKKVADLPDDELSLQTAPTILPGGFLVERISVDVIGVCPDCQARPN
ncbi:Fe2+/Zn2+ uptake regulation protein [Terriglobus roseus DSM 18391]|uniref:Fe2+/Zn2+ uptake regulation protein n=1 Tax=Terriglobus roseus (strain DSM 18391 / NRRL B-41598 / KBS 63) TaxID=926566 RepID=I3ZCY9_TERRK|nr:transcriptional repressor [Terriglobus roseus]AFL87107.1 Fe2+/Zn2+ uptake regulation protein [Terriglobus roseus DSM 18391]